MIKVTAPKDRSVRLRSTTGVSLHLAAGETRVVAPMFNVAAAHQGCAVQPIGSTPQPESEPVAQEDGSRIEAIRSAINELIETGDSNELTAAGNPRTSAIRNRTGLEVTAAEIQSVMHSDDGK